MNKLFEKKVILVTCVIGFLVGVIFYRYVYDDLEFIEKYYKFMVSQKGYINIDINRLFYFIFLYELKQTFFLLIICITKYRRILIMSLLFFYSFIISIQLFGVLDFYNSILLFNIVILMFEKVYILSILFLCDFYISRDKERANSHFKIIHITKIISLYVFFVMSISVLLSIFIKIFINF